MACRSGNVETAADKSVAAKEQIDKLESMISAQSEDFKTKFYAQIADHLAAANITDAREIEFNIDVKTEYSSEFSLDRIVKVVTTALKAVEAVKSAGTENPATSPEAIAAYTDVVNTVAEAAKSSSQSAASVSFSMTRLSPGIIAFMSATSTNIKDEDTFGSEAVTTTAILHQIIESINDVANETAFGLAIIDAKSIIDMKIVQAALVPALADGKITFEVFAKTDKEYQKWIESVQIRLAREGQPQPTKLTLNVRQGYGPAIDHSFETGSKATQDIVRNAIDKLSTMGEQFKPAIAITQSRLQTNYF